MTKPDPDAPLILGSDLLSGAAARLVADHARTHGVSEAQAAATLLNALGASRRRAMLDWFSSQWPAQPGADSAAILRELRNGR